MCTDIQRLFKYWLPVVSFHIHTLLWKQQCFISLLFTFSFLLGSLTPKTKFFRPAVISIMKPVYRLGGGSSKESILCFYFKQYVTVSDIQLGLENHDKDFLYMTDKITYRKCCNYIGYNQTMLFPASQ